MYLYLRISLSEKAYTPGSEFIKEITFNFILAMNFKMPTFITSVRV